MKKMLLLVVAAMMATMSVNAQNGYDTKHEIGVNYGFMSNTQWLDATMMALHIVEGLDPVKGSVIGPVSAEYFYHVNDWLGVGGIFTYAYTKATYDQTVDHTAEVYTSKSAYYTVLPAVKFNWLRRDHFGMYSKIGAGVMVGNLKAVPADPTEKPESETEWGFNWQVSVLGIEFGGAQLRGFIEGGIGAQGVALAGIRYKF